MKKLIAALILATSFAAFADDAAKTRRSEERQEGQEGEEVRSLELPPPVRPPSRLPRSNSSAVLEDRGRAMGRVARVERAARPVVVSGVPQRGSPGSTQVLGHLDGRPRRRP